MAEAVVQLNNLEKRFPGQAKPALNGITAEIHGGMVTGLVGPDGAGKTTLMRLIAGLLDPTSGSVCIGPASGPEITEAGTNIPSPDPLAGRPSPLTPLPTGEGDRSTRALTRPGPDSPLSRGEGPGVRGSLRRSIETVIGYMPQRFGLYEDLSVQENLELHAELRGVTGAERDDTFRQVLEFTDLGRFTGRLAGKLSGGMKQKLGLACALLGHPQLLLLDEPSVGVDPISRRELWRMVNGLAKQGLTIVWSTAYLDEAELSQEVLLLNEGRLLFDGAPGALTARVKDRCFQIRNIAGSRRQVLARALRDPAVLDGIIQGRNVRLVLRQSKPGSKAPFGLGPPSPLTPLPRGEGDPSLFPGGEGRGVRGEPPSGDRFPSPRGRGVKGEGILYSGSQGSLEQGELVPVAPRFEDAFIDVLGGGPGGESALAQQLEPKHGDHETVVEAINLTRKFGSFVATDNITFSVKRGEIFGLLGPNGAGKSTTFRMLCGLLTPSSGAARVMGIDLRKSPSRARQRLGYMAQKFSLYGNLTVRQNLEFFSGAYGLVHGSQQEAVNKMVEVFHLRSLAGTNTGGLPPGLKQRLALAVAMIHSPDLVFLDEPTSGVDPVTRREFWTHINGIVEKGVTVVVTTHFMEEAEYCDRVALVSRGRIIAEGTPDALKEQAATAETPDPSMEDAFIHLVQRAEESTTAETSRTGQSNLRGSA